LSDPFRFHTRLNLVELLGRRAGTVRELLTGIREVPGGSIYHHTHRFLQQHHFLSPEPPNDFAYWISGSLGLNDIGERLASVDTVRYRRINDLRTRYVEILEEALAVRRNSWPVCQESDEFHFMSCRTFIIPLPAVARDAGEFLDILGRISVNSLYYHVFESRLRLERGENDFAVWFEARGDHELAGALARLDPYTITLEGLRQEIIGLVRRHVQDR
jgi:hypothetical protein